MIKDHRMSGDFEQPAQATDLYLLTSQNLQELLAKLEIDPKSSTSIKMNLFAKILAKSGNRLLKKQQKSFN